MKVLFKVLFIAICIAIAYAFRALARKNKGDQSEEVYNGLASVFESMPWVMIILGVLILIIAFIFILIEG